MTVQTQVMRKIYDPEKMRKEVEAQIEEKKKQQKRGVKSTTVKVTDPKTGKVTEKNLSASEMNKRRWSMPVSWTLSVTRTSAPCR